MGGGAAIDAAIDQGAVARVSPRCRVPRAFYFAIELRRDGPEAWYEATPRSPCSHATMIELDLSTIIMLHVSVLLAGSGAFFHLRRLGVKPGALNWLGLGYGAQALGAFLAVLGEKHNLPDWLWQSASLWLGVTGYVLVWAGLCRLSRGRKWCGDEGTVILVPLACLVFAAATGALSSSLERAGIFHLAAFASLAAAAVEIHCRGATKPLLSRKPMAAILAFLAFSFIAGLVIILSGLARPDRIAAIFFVQTLCYFAVALFVCGLLTERLAGDLRGLAERDPLTGLGNRARLEHLLPLAPARGTAAIMVDIDHFKHVNDRHGHQAGDKVLRGIGHLLLMELRESDLCIRYGGEEFLIVVREADAVQLAERLRSRIASHEVDAGQDQPVRVTASFGIAVHRSGECSWAELIEAADRALYEAKTRGRNRVVLREDGVARGQWASA